MGINYEEREQIKIFNWAKTCEYIYPELKLMHHIPNGGKRDDVTGHKLKLQGVKKGVPDICLPAARSGYHGLYIELKVGKNKPTKEQSEFIAALTEQGYLAVVCYGAGSAIEIIKNYLGGRL